MGFIAHWRGFARLTLCAAGSLAALALTSCGTPPNTAPTALLTATPSSGSASLLVDFDASGSTDDGTIVNHEWDFDGDGTWDEDTGATPTTSHNYMTAGTYVATVRVTDNDGDAHEATRQIWAQQWNTLAVDTVGNVGSFTSAALIDGKPAISYYDDTNDDLKYAYSSTADGSSGWTAITVDAPGSVGWFTSLAVINGKPAISYRDNSNSDLKYAYSSTADGSSGWTTVTVDSVGSVGVYSSLALVNGKPAISYWDQTNHDLKYAYSSTAEGSSGWTAIAVDTVSFVGGYTSLLEMGDGTAAISYYDFTNQDLKYAWLD